MQIKIANTEKEIKDVLHVRHVVFVEEQNVPLEREQDEYEDESIHLIGYLNDRPIAAGRVRFMDEYGKLERICVLKKCRGKKYGTKMIQFMEKVIADKGYQKATLNAQKHAEDFYEHLGYKTVSGEFLDAGIPHVTMEKNL